MRHFLSASLRVRLRLPRLCRQLIGVCDRLLRKPNLALQLAIRLVGAPNLGRQLRRLRRLSLEARFGLFHRSRRRELALDHLLGRSLGANLRRGLRGLGGRPRARDLRFGRLGALREPFDVPQQLVSGERRLSLRLRHLRLPLRHLDRRDRLVHLLVLDEARLVLVDGREERVDRALGCVERQNFHRLVELLARDLVVAIRVPLGEEVFEPLHVRVERHAQLGERIADFRLVRRRHCDHDSHKTRSERARCGQVQSKTEIFNKASVSGRGVGPRARPKYPKTYDLPGSTVL